jgi:hypothetical protein
MPGKTPNDAVIDEVREVRRRISARFDHDPKKLVEHYIDLQERHGERLIRNVSGSRRREAPA